MKGVFSGYETQFHIHAQRTVTWGGGGGGGRGGELERGKKNDDDDDEISNVHIVVKGLNSFVYLRFQI